MEYFLGIDQGGTKTEAIICDRDGRIFGKGRAGGLAGVYIRDTGETYIKHMRYAAEQAARQADLPLSAVTAACACLNGADWNFEYSYLCMSVYKAVGCPDVTVINDCVGAGRAGTAAAQRAVVCAGSGMNIAVRRADMREIVYGYYIHTCDQGGSALGGALLDAVADSYNNLGPPTIMTGLVLEKFQCENIEELYIKMTAGDCVWKPKDFAPLVLLANRHNDAVAADLLDAASARYSLYVTGAMERLGILGEPLDIVYSGSIFKDDGVAFADNVQRHILTAAPGAKCVHARYEPVCGAALILLDRHWRGDLPSRVAERFDADALEFGLYRSINRQNEAIQGYPG